MSTGTYEYLQDAERMRTGQTAREPDKPYTNAADELRSSTVHIYPVASVRSFAHVQNLLTDRTAQNGHHLTRNAFTALGTDM